MIKQVDETYSIMESHHVTFDDSSLFGASEHDHVINEDTHDARNSSGDDLEATESDTEVSGASSEDLCIDDIVHDDILHNTDESSTESHSPDILEPRTRLVGEDGSPEREAYENDVEGSTSEVSFEK